MTQPSTAAAIAAAVPAAIAEYVPALPDATSPAYLAAVAGVRAWPRDTRSVFAGVAWDERDRDQAAADILDAAQQGYDLPHPRIERVRPALYALFWGDDPGHDLRPCPTCGGRACPDPETCASEHAGAVEDYYADQL